MYLSEFCDVRYEEVRNGGGAEQWPVLEFYVGEKRYQNNWPELKNASVGDEIEIYYYPMGESYVCTLYVTDYRMIYFPLFVLGIILLFIRWKKLGKIK
ncbi:MAG: hypothetical protein E7289_02700 [Lachnospiraceae bacterium]|nr:hypothetical protein [Lachnospiraceae bacterium]